MHLQVGVKVLSLSPWFHPHKVEGEKWLVQVVLWPLAVPVTLMLSLSFLLCPSPPPHERNSKAQSYSAGRADRGIRGARWATHIAKRISEYTKVHAWLPCLQHLWLFSGLHIHSPIPPPHSKNVVCALVFTGLRSGDGILHPTMCHKQWWQRKAPPGEVGWASRERRWQAGPVASFLSQAEGMGPFVPFSYAKCVMQPVSQLVQSNFKWQTKWSLRIFLKPLLLAAAYLVKHLIRGENEWGFQQGLLRPCIWVAFHFQFIPKADIHVSTVKGSFLQKLFTFFFSWNA